MNNSIVTTLNEDSYEGASAVSDNVPFKWPVSGLVGRVVNSQAKLLSSQMWPLLTSVVDQKQAYKRDVPPLYLGIAIPVYFRPLVSRGHVDNSAGWQLAITLLVILITYDQGTRFLSHYLLNTH
jgi:hypothetical protein